MLLQIPVFFSLYKVILVTIEMRHAPFFGWIQDLSATDPTNVFNLFGLIPFDPSVFSPYLHLGIWPVLMGATHVLHAEAEPAAAGPDAGAHAAVHAADLRLHHGPLSRRPGDLLDLEQPADHGAAMVHPAPGQADDACCTGVTAAGEPDDAEIERGRLLFAAECRFYFAAQRIDQLPDARLPEIAFAGRSNVGKSSLINALTGTSALARTSSEPGRTKQLNFFDLGGRLVLVDMPGYGYAQAAKEVKEDWQGLMFDFLRGRVVLRRVVLLLDARIELKASDHAVMDLFDRAAVGFQLVLTKIDGLKPDRLARKRAELAPVVKAHPAAYPEIVATSSRSGEGIDLLRASLSSLAQDRPEPAAG